MTGQYRSEGSDRIMSGPAPGRTLAGLVLVPAKALPEDRSFIGAVVGVLDELLDEESLVYAAGGDAHRDRSRRRIPGLARIVEREPSPPAGDLTDPGLAQALATWFGAAFSGEGRRARPGRAPRSR
jgi:hypothetical protein